MESSKQYAGNPDDLIIFEKLLPEEGMFLFDQRAGKDGAIIYRSRSKQIEATSIKRHQANQWKPQFQVFIEGDNWGYLNAKLFDDMPALADALRKRGLKQVEF
jgi:hypothetical protein